jgi:tetracycline repressor-like protein
VIADGLAELISVRFGISLETVRLPIAVAIEIADGILDLAFRRKLFATETMIAEARSVVRGYLSGRLRGSATYSDLAPDAENSPVNLRRVKAPGSSE